MPYDNSTLAYPHPKASKMAKLVKMLAVKPDDPGSILETNIMEEKKQLLCARVCAHITVF